MFVEIQNIKKPYDEMPSNPGIPGDYFECDEMMLVQKLNTLRSRTSGPVHVPSLLSQDSGDGSSSSSSVLTIEVEPDSLFAAISVDDDDDDDGECDAGESSRRRQTGNVFRSEPKKRLDAPDPKSPANVLSAAAALKVSASGVSDTKSDSSPTSACNFPEDVLVLKMKPTSTSTSASQPTRRPRRRLSTPATASMSMSMSPSHNSSSAQTIRRRQELREKFRFPSEVTLLKIDDSVDGSSPLHHELIIKHSPIASSVTSSSTSSGGKGTGTGTGTDTGGKKHGTTNENNPSGIPQEEELFMKLADKGDLEAFKVINNFSHRGDHLFSSILREQTRIQLKRKMLQDGEIDLLCQLQVQAQDKKKKSRNPTLDRGIYYAI